MTSENTRFGAASRQTVELYLRQALEKLLQSDATLLDLDVSERAIAHRVAMYLEGLFRGWNVDCEYNRKGADRVAKTLSWRPWLHPSDEPPKVFPDIIVHRREVQENLLVVEIKKSTSCRSDVDDMRKLAVYTRPREEGGLGYKYGAFVRVGVCGRVPAYEIAKWYPEAIVGA